jgi:hypothetical protein
MSLRVTVRTHHWQSGKTGSDRQSPTCTEARLVGLLRQTRTAAQPHWRVVKKT